MQSMEDLQRVLTFKTWIDSRVQISGRIAAGPHRKRATSNTAHQKLYDLDYEAKHIGLHLQIVFIV